VAFTDCCWQVVMGKVRYFAIIFNNDKTVYHPGEQVTGQCLLELKSDMKMRALHMFMRGVAKVDVRGFVYIEQHLVTVDK